MTQSHKSTGPTWSRRQVIGGMGAAGALAAMPWAHLEAQVEEMKAQGWEAQPVICNMCGGGCGLLRMHKPGTPLSKETIRIMPNPTHPQRGYCARGASAMWAWNHPLRLKKPLKRVGERGEGKFQEVSWDEALNDIAQRLKTNIEKYGAKSVTMTSHDFTGFQKWLSAGLDLVNVINHSSTCNAASIFGRQFVYGGAFKGAGKMDPDYANVPYLLLSGRTLNCAIGIASVVANAKRNGTEVVFVDPRMPEGALTGVTWVPIKPGTDAALFMAMMHVAMKEGLINDAFLKNQSNAGYLVTANQVPVTQDMVKAGGDATLYAVMDAKTQKLAWRGTTKDDKGENAGFIESPDTDVDLYYTGTIHDKDGQEVPVMTSLVALREHVAEMTPEKASEITAIPVETITKITRDFFTKGGVVDDGWYSSRNGNDAGTYMLLNVLNVLNGNIDKVGGMIVTQGGGLKLPSPGYSKGKGNGPTGQKWEVENGDMKPLDKMAFAEAAGTYSAVFDAINTEKPYFVSTVIVTGSSMFHREAGTQRMKDALKKVDFVVVQDIFPHEICDYADYVLPTTYFMEWNDYQGVKWAANGYVHKTVGLPLPEGNDSRHEVWQFAEILRRIDPALAENRLGYTECKTTDEFNAWYYGMQDKAFAKFVAGLNEAKEGSGDKLQASIEKQGWGLVKAKKYEQFPYVKPFATPTGKAEIVSFAIQKHAEKLGGVIPSWVQAPAYTAPKPDSDEFVLVSGKDSSASSGTNMFVNPSAFLGDRTIWMNPVDAARLKIQDGDTIELTGLDNGAVGQATVKLTNRVIEGALFSHGFQGGVRAKNLTKAYSWATEGVNSHWFTTGYREPVSGVVSNNSSVRVRRV